MKEILKQVRKIEISTKELVDGLISGNYHSVFKGQGIEFREIREYVPGDDIRAIDWKVTARYNKPYVKEYIEERDLCVYFLFDISASGQFGNTVSKNQKAIELSASLMFSALRNNDNIGLLLFSDKIEQFIPARKGKKHVLALISKILSHKAESKKTNINNALKYISKVVKRKSIIFIVSDFISDDYKKSLRILRNRHDVIGINIFDNREANLPDVGYIELEDEETGEQVLVDTSDKDFRERYFNIVKEAQDKISTMMKKMKIDMLNIKTDEPYIIPLKKFFAIRKHRVR